MIPSELIRKKREGQNHSKEEIEFIVHGASHKKIPQYQLSAWLMAVYFKSMSAQETTWLTEAMKNSGDSYDWKTLNPKLKNYPLIDKHSTGGVGDKVSLILVPLAVHLGLRVPMMSGRGLGHTGGTVDKLLSIPGFKMDIDAQEAAKIMGDVGAVMLSQTEKLCPADKALYHLRDVTATVESNPLITASIVSKKWAEGCEGIVFDVKFGEGAFMDTPEKAEELGSWLMRVSQLAGLKAEAMLTRMEEPLGTCIGNALEVKESLWILKNEYPSELHKELATPLKKLCCQMAARMALLGGTRKDFEAAVMECEKYLNSGQGYELFDKLALAQGAQENWHKKLPQTAKTFDVLAPTSGCVSDIVARSLGVLGLEVGIGRRSVEDQISPEVGFELFVTPGSLVKQGDLLAKLHLNEKPSEKFLQSFLACFEISDLNSGQCPKAGALLWKVLSN